MDRVLQVISLSCICPPWIEAFKLVQWLTKFSLWMPHSLWVQNRNVHFAQFVGTVAPCNHFLTHSAKLSPQTAHSGVKYFLKENHIVIHLHFHQIFIKHSLYTSLIFEELFYFLVGVPCVVSSYFPLCFWQEFQATI